MLVNELTLGDKGYVFFLHYPIIHAAFRVLTVSAVVFVGDEVAGFDLHWSDSAGFGDFPIGLTESAAFYDAFAGADCDDQATAILFFGYHVKNAGLKPLDWLDEDVIG